MSRLIQFINEGNNPKYPRTYHLPFSETISSDDKRLDDVSHFYNKSLTITRKMDGSNVGLSFDLMSSRSGITPDHPSFSLLKQKYASFRANIPKDFIFYGEWLYAKHSIEYANLDDYLMIFAILNTTNGMWLSWSDVKEYCSLLNIHTVPIVYDHITLDDKSFEPTITKIAQSVIKDGDEGIVIRYSGSFRDFAKSTAKYVRPNHVQTDGHWMFKKITPNKVKGTI